MRLRTSAELYSAIDTIDRLSSSVYKTDRGEFDTLLDESPYIKDYLMSQNVNLSSPVSVIVDNLSQLKTQLENTDKIVLTLSVEPGSRVIDKIYEKIISFVGRDVVVDIVVHPEILGGIQISYRGKYLDLSLKDKLDSYFKGFHNINDLLTA